MEGLGAISSCTIGCIVGFQLMHVNARGDKANAVFKALALQNILVRYTVFSKNSAPLTNADMASRECHVQAFIAGDPFMRLDYLKYLSSSLKHSIREPLDIIRRQGSSRIYGKAKLQA